MIRSDAASDFRAKTMRTLIFRPTGVGLSLTYLVWNTNSRTGRRIATQIVVTSKSQCRQDVLFGPYRYRTHGHAYSRHYLRDRSRTSRQKKQTTHKQKRRNQIYKTRSYLWSLDVRGTRGGSERISFDFSSCARPRIRSGSGSFVGRATSAKLFLLRRQSKKHRRLY